MKIGIDASRAFVQNRTGIEEYSYQVIKSLMDTLKDHQARLASARLDSTQCPIESNRSSGQTRESRRVVLYVRKNQVSDLNLPENWKIKVIRWPYLWTQIGLSLEMLLHPVDILFIPAHTVPLIHPKNTIVTVHGLEYEFCPQAYSFFGRNYMRLVIKNSCKWAKKIIAVSENTKKDLIELYKVSKNKIEVVYNGMNVFGDYSKNINEDKKYLLFVGRLEERKNVCGIVKAFEILKNKYNVPHKLVLAGKPGYGWNKIKNQISKCKNKEDIILRGFVSDEEKAKLLDQADVFLFPSLYEGFGLPILEAQSVGTPVVTSNVSSMPEVAGESALLVDPNDSGAIAEATYRLISDLDFKNDIINRGFENVKRFSWEKCAKEITKLIIE